MKKENIDETKLKEEIEKLEIEVARLDKEDDTSYLVYGHPIQEAMREHDKKVALLQGFEEGKAQQKKEFIEMIDKSNTNYDNHI